MTQDRETAPRKVPEWMAQAVQERPLVVRSLDTVAIVMSVHDYNALVLLIGVAAATSPFLETALRLMRGFNPAPPKAAP